MRNHNPHPVATFTDVDNIDYEVTAEASVWRPYGSVPTVGIGTPGRSPLIEFDAEAPEGLAALSALIDGLTEARRRVQVSVQERYGHLQVGDDLLSFEVAESVDAQCNLLIAGTGRVCNRIRHADEHHVAFNPDTDEVLAVMHGRPE